MPSMAIPQVLLDVRKLGKTFPGVRALHHVSLAFERGEVHGLIGENGAGKSTLMKILAGVYQPDTGEILLDGRPIRFKSVADAQSHGVAMIHQELNLIDELSVAENIFLGREAGRGGFVRSGVMRQQAKEILHRLRAPLNPRERVGRLSVAEKQLVEIAKAVSCQARVLIMDEPTAVLSSRETAALYELIMQLRDAGVAVIYISHLLTEVLQVCGRITVLRDGEVVRTLGREEVRLSRERDLASLMVGRPMADHFPPRRPPTQVVELTVENLCSGEDVRDVSLTIHRGEILGLAGLVGAGRTELAETIAGLRPRRSGRISLGGETVEIRGPRDAVHQGIAYLSEDRKGRGLILPMSVRENIVLVSLRKYGRWLLSRSRQQRAADEYVRALRIRLADGDAPVSELSGGNQQKVAIAKWLEIAPRVLILDEPTRGVDIGAKEEIYRLIQSLAEAGRAVLVISSELNELLGLCHRIGVMREGRLMGVVDGASATEESLMHLAAGLREAAGAESTHGATPGG